MRGKLTLPLRIELWNGQHLDFSSEPARVTIRLPDAGRAALPAHAVAVQPGRRLRRRRDRVKGHAPAT
jgi:hypothetical protein